MIGFEVKKSIEIIIKIDGENLKFGFKLYKNIYTISQFNKFF